MKTDKLRINQLSPQAYDWYLSYLKAIDAKNIETYGSFLADKCVMQFNNDSYEGKTAVIQNISDYWNTFNSVTHDLLNIYGSDRSFVLEALNHYQRNDSKTVTVRAVAITDRNERGLVTSSRLYSDTTPLFA